MKYISIHEKDYVAKQRKLAKLAEQKTSHFRAWKVGKSWLYTAATLTLVLSNTQLAQGVVVSAQAIKALAQEEEPVANADDLTPPLSSSMGSNGTSYDHL